MSHEQRLPASDYRYGVVCPLCAGPKSKQYASCAACYRDARRAGHYHAAPIMRGAANPNYKHGRYAA